MSETRAYPWLILGYGVVMQAVTIGIATYSFAFFVLPWMKEFGVLRSVLMLAVMGLSIATTILSPVCGYLLDRYSSRTLVLAGASSYVLGLLAIAASPNAITIVLSFVLLISVGTVLSGPLMASTLVARAFIDRRGLALGLSAVGTSLGGLVMPVLVTRFLDQYDWRLLFVSLAGLVIALVIAPAVLMLRGASRPYAEHTNSSIARSSLSLMRSPTALKLGVAYVVPALLFVAVLHNLGSLAADLSISQQHAAWIASTASAAMAASKIMSGFLCDRVELRILYLGVLALLFAGIATLYLATTFGLLLAGVTLMSIAAGFTLPVISSFAACHWGTQNFGSVMGVVFAMAGLSGFGPVISSAIRDVTGSYLMAFLGLTVVIVPAAWCFFTLPRSIPPTLQVRSTPPD